MKQMSEKNWLAVRHWRDMTLARSTELRLISLDDAADVLRETANGLGTRTGPYGDRPQKSPRRPRREGKINPKRYRDMRRPGR